MVGLLEARVGVRAYGCVVEFRFLGPIEVYSGDSLGHVGGVKQRRILALLIANHGAICLLRWA